MRFNKFRTAFVAALAATAVAALPAGAQTTSNGALKGTTIGVGISDQKSSTFEDKNFTSLGLPYARLVMPWDWDGSPGERRRTAEWLDKARAIGIRPLIAWNHPRSQDCVNPAASCRIPRVATVIASFKRFRAAFPHVMDHTSWNEGNHASQPTGRNKTSGPKFNAQVYNGMRAACPSCRVIAADLLDGKNLPSWLKIFNQYVKGKPRLWGLHNYSDTNRPERRGAGTKQMLNLTRGEVWVTETGGLVEFKTFAGKVTFPCDEARASKSIREMARLAKTSSRIKRLYIYQWQKTSPSDRFDAGLVRNDNTPRPSFAALQDELGISPAFVTSPSPNCQ